MRIRCVVLAAGLLMARTVDPPVTTGVRTVPASDSRPSSCVEVLNQNYVIWRCDDTGQTVTDRAVLVHFRRTVETGGIAFRPLWSGPANALASVRDAMIANDAAAYGRCRAFFHVVGSDAGVLQFNRVTRSMAQWWRAKGAREVPGLCYTSDPLYADYVLVWRDRTDTIPYSFAMPVTSTSRINGTVTTNQVGQWPPVRSNYSGTVTTTEMQTYTGNRTEWNVVMEVYPMYFSKDGTSTPGIAIHTTDRTGRWAWSKPDKDVFRDALRFLAGKESRTR